MNYRTGRIAAAIMAAVFSVVSIAGCSQSGSTGEMPVQLTRVESQKASRGTLELTSTYVGTLSPYTSVNVVPLVSGTVETVNVKVGDKVEVGDVLCKFDDEPADLQLQSAKDAVNTAKAGKQAAKDQIHAARKQADASITSLESQRSTLKDQKKSTEKQLKEVKGSLGTLKDAQDSAAQAYNSSKSIYDKTNDLFIRYQGFIAANPDCATTAGLVSASIPETVVTEVSGGGKENDGNVLVFSVPGEEQEGQENGGSGGGVPQYQEKTVSSEKQRTAAALLKALGEVPIAVEYMSTAGLAMLRDQMEQAKAMQASAQSGYAQASSSVKTLENTISQLDSQIKALDKNIGAAKSAADATAGTQVYDAQIKAAETGVDSAEYQKDLYVVKAPISGIVETVSVTEKQMAAQGQPAFTISDKEIMTVSFYVPESVRDHLRIGDTVNIDSTGGDLKASITSIATSLDQQKGLFKIEADILTIADKSLLSNTSVNLSVVSDSVENEILIPFDAVYYDNDQAYVFIVDRGTDQTRAVRRNVTAGLYSEDMIAIPEGISDGEEVVTSWGAGLKDGAVIEVMPAPSD